MSCANLPGLSGMGPGHVFADARFFSRNSPMPKADGDPRSRDVADAGRDAASPSKPEANVKSAAATTQDDIPPVHVLEAAQKQDRKETEDLLAGFDRPGRGPKPASKERDFVDYYARKKSGAESGSGRVASSAPPVIRVKQADVSTVIKPRKKEGPPAWLVWAGAAALMLAVGGVVAFLATSDPRPSALAPTGPSAATTITAATPPRTAFDNAVPPPAPADATATTTATTITVAEPASVAAPPARGSAKRDARAAPATPNAAGGASTQGVGAGAPASAPRATNATDDTKPPPRDDFIRDL
jgi:hypothetical protein